jgi:cell division protein FtsQ
MADFAAVSRAELAERRRKLRRQRRFRILQACWRSLAVMGITGGLVWVITLPAWVIRNPQQVEIEGNQLLATEAIQSLLAINYPQSLLQLKPEAIAQQLEDQAPIASVTVTRRLFPPGLTVQLRERQPVAISFVTPNDAATSLATNASARRVGLLDENGTWMPLESYTSLNQSLELPTLKVIGMPEQYQSQWAALYRAISTSPVKVFEIDWQSANLVLKTELGVVHFGAYSPRFVQQLQALDRMRELPQTVNPAQIAYIDLKNPDAPSVQMLQDNRQSQPPPP